MAQARLDQREGEWVESGEFGYIESLDITAT